MFTCWGWNGRILWVFSCSQSAGMLATKFSDQQTTGLVILLDPRVFVISCSCDILLVCISSFNIPTVTWSPIPNVSCCDAIVGFFQFCWVRFWIELWSFPLVSKKNCSSHSASSCTAQLYKKLFNEITVAVLLYGCVTGTVQPQSCALTAPEHLGTEEIIHALPKICYLVRPKWTLLCAAIPLPKAYFWKYLLVLARMVGLQLSLNP